MRSRWMLRALAVLLIVGLGWLGYARADAPRWSALSTLLMWDKAGTTGPVEVTTTDPLPVAFNGGTAYPDRFCLDNTNRDTGASRSAAGVLKIDDCASTAKLLYASGLTTTGTASVTGITLAAAESVGLASGGTLIFNALDSNSTGLVGVEATAAQVWTSGTGSGFHVNAAFTPASGSGSWAGMHLNPIINGTSSGTAYGLGIASRTNTLTGGTVKLLSAGTTTTDLFTGYTEVFAVSPTGIISSGGNAGLTVTKTVRAAGGAADCTLIFTGGLLTGGTC